MPETTNTPAGEYPRPAATHHLDLDAEADRLVSKLPGNRRQTKNLSRESEVSVLMMAMEAGDALQEHSAAGVVTVQGMRGSAVLSVGEESYELRPGHLIVLQPGIRHDIRAEAQAVLLLTIAGRD